MAALLFASGLEAQSADSMTGVAQRVTALADEYVEAYVRTFPVSAELSGLTGVPHDRLDANDRAAVRAWRAREDGWAAELGRMDGAALWGRPEWVIYGFLREAIDASRGLRVCRLEWWPVNQMAGWQTLLPSVAEAQPVGSREARRDALRRWAGLPRWLDVEVRNAREGLGQGYSTPRPAVELVRRQLDGLLALPDTAWPLWSPAARDTSPQFRKEWRQLMAGRLRPAVARYRDFLVQEYLPRARESLAVGAHPNGEACYRAAFRSNTSLDRAPGETFRLGEAAVAGNHDEMREIGRRLLGTEDLAAMLTALDSAPGARFVDRDEQLAYVTDAVERARQAMPGWFGRLPEAAVVIEPYPAFLEQGTFDRYEPAPEDGSRPATYRINLREPARATKARAEITAFHETYPGHHLQIALAQSARAHPITRLVWTGAFGEGWARYAEGLAEEIGLHRAPLAPLARRAWPAHGMVADVGLHLLGWSGERVAAYVAEGRLVPQGQEMEQLVMRFAVLPGQITAYDTGALEIRALRAEAEQALGPRFDLKGFHDRVLENGAITLPMLRESIRRWIAERQAR
ncbi:MAG TPA: DUF885 domain-containing protein [Gemmatimonadales bacterium]|nr:DUF885 domain-containing protein [Gemmatimonadales bacterium]